MSVVLIGNGNATFAEAFRQDFELECPILVDPDLAAYRAAGLRRGPAAAASPKAFVNSLRALRSGARQTAVQGDPWQLGGVFVLGAGGELRLAQRSKAAGDHAEPEAIDAALAPDAPAIDESLEASPLAPVASLFRPLLDLSPVLSFDRIGFARHALAFDPSDLAVDLYGQRAVVTGANSGIGLAAARALADLGAEVILLCRNEERGKKAAQDIIEATGNRRVSNVTVDLSDFESIDGASEQLGAEPIDILVHNAGVLPKERIESPQGHELCLATHVAGPHRLTQNLLAALEDAEGARVIWVSSGGMLTRRLNVDDPEWLDRKYDGVLAYAETKRAQVVLAELWAEAVEHSSISVNSMHPGWADTPSVETALPRFHEWTERILRTPDEAADTIVWLAASGVVEGRTGEFFFDRQATHTHWLPTTQETEEEREALWQLCSSFEAADT